MSNRKRICALLLCAVMTLLLVVSSAYIVLEAGHVCSGEACETCENIAKTEALLHGLGRFALVLLFAVAALCVPNAFSALRGTRLPALDTLVCWKVRLNN